MWFYILMCKNFGFLLLNLELDARIDYMGNPKFQIHSLYTYHIILFPFLV